MPPDAPLCELCGHKWVVIGGGLCQICRTVDRLAAIVRSPEVPVSAECIVLQRLRACIGELQDLGELTRGVAPNPVQRPLAEAGGPPPNTPGPAPGSVGATSKAPPATPPTVSTPPLSSEPVPEAPEAPASRHRLPAEVKGDATESSPARGTAASSSRPDNPERKRRSAKSPRSPRRSRKRSRRSRSGRSRDRARRPRLASPVRPEEVKAEETDSEERARRRERKSRPLRPRSPSRPPPLHRDPAPSRRPEGRRWVGPIPARRREPPPGHGRHFGKNKGQTERRKRADYQGRRPRYWERR